VKYRLKAPNANHLDFDSYQDLLAALRPFRNNLDGLVLEEIDSEGNVQATLNNTELRQVIAELDAIVLPNVLSVE